jgi:D-sedoheptulose 7-phosphate isomerase
MNRVLTDFLAESVEIRQKLLANSQFSEAFDRAVVLLLKTKALGGTIYTCGNGGSTCDAVHFVEELVAVYKRERKGIRAAHLMDSSILTCWSNDRSYETVFSRQVETMCRKGDILVAFTTSGNSKNILSALEIARKMSIPTILLTGKDGGLAKNIADVSLIVPAVTSDRIQEVHITLVHAFCEILEREL